MSANPSTVARRSALRRSALLTAGGLLAFVAALGCHERVVPSIDSNTNWLTVCDADRDCSAASTCRRRVCIPLASAANGSSEVAAQRPATDERDAGTAAAEPTCIEACTEGGSDAETCRTRCAEPEPVSAPTERPTTEPTDEPSDEPATNGSEEPATATPDTRPSEPTEPDTRPTDEPTEPATPTGTGTDDPATDMTEPPLDAPLTCYDACVSGGSEATCRDRCADAADPTKCLDDCTLGGDEATCRARCTSLSCYDTCLDGDVSEAACREQCVAGASSPTCREDCLRGGAEAPSCDRYCTTAPSDGAAGAPSR